MSRMARTDGGYFGLLFPLELAAPLPGRGLAIQRCFRALYICQIRKTLIGALTWTNRQSVGAAWRWRGGLRPCSAPGLSNKGPFKAITTPFPEFALPLRKQVHCPTRVLSCARLGRRPHITRKRFLAPCFPVRPFDPCGPRARELYQELEMQSKTRAMALIGLTLPVATHAADLGDTDTAIRLALLPETGPQISAHVAGEVLGAMGYAVEYVEADQMRVFSDMRQGRIDVNVEVWEARAPGNYRDMILDGDLQDMGELGVTLSEGPAAGIIEALGLPFEVRPAASEADLSQTLTEASTSGDPALVMFWRPHWAVAAQDLRFVTLPTPEAACYETPSWGPNPDLPGDCGIPSLEAVKTVIKGTKIKWPAAWYMLEDFQIDTETQETLMRAVEQDGRPVAEVAAEWRAANEETWQPVVDAALAQ